MASYVFPKVEPADIQKSNRNLSIYKAFTASCGPLYPALCVDMLPDDWMRVNTIATVQSLPMIAPVRGRWKVSFDYYFEPWSNLYGFMDNDTRLSVEAIIKSERWTISSFPFKNVSGPFEVYPEISSTFPSLWLSAFPKVGAGSLLDYLGFPVGYSGKMYTSTEMVNGSPRPSVVIESTLHPAESLLTYIDIVRNYYVNNQLAQIPYVSRSEIITTDALPAFDGYMSHNYTGIQNVSDYEYVNLTDLDRIFRNVRYYSSEGSPTQNLMQSLFSPAGTILRLIYASLGLDNETTVTTNYRTHTGKNCGLFLRNYRMDLLRGIMNTSVGSYNSKVNTITDNGQTYVTMDDIYFGNKLQQLINRIDITGGRFSDWIRTRWNVDTGIQVDRPIYLGSHSMWLNTIDVVATSAGQSGEDSNNPNTELAQQAGYQVGKMSGKQRPITIKSKQYGTLMCIFSIVPDVVYSQGFELNMLKTKFSDIYDPAFKQIGFQPVSRLELDAFPEVSFNDSDSEGDPVYDGSTFGTVTPASLNDAVGRRIAWSEYMAGLNRVHGDFAFGESLDFWVNNRVYHNTEMTFEDGSVPVGAEGLFARLAEFDGTTYVLPTLWNNPFADKSLSANNYIVDVYFAIDANRSLGKRLMPHM